MFGLLGLELLVVCSIDLPALARPTFGDCAKAVERELSHLGDGCPRIEIRD
jgi:hypothetical protein